jgi:NACHT domain
MAIIKRNIYRKQAPQAAHITHNPHTLYKGNTSAAKIGPPTQKLQPTLVRVPFTYPLPTHWRTKQLAHSIASTLHTAAEHDTMMQARLHSVVQAAHTTWLAEQYKQTQTPLPWEAHARSTSTSTSTQPFPLPLPLAWATMQRQAKQIALRFAHDAINTLLPWMVWEVPNPRYPGQTIRLDADQCYAVAWFLWSGASFVITGPAGSGKTLLLQALAIAWARKNPELHYEYKLPMHMRTSLKDSHRYAPAMYIGSFTNKAVGVLRQKVLASAELAAAGFGPNMMSMHALLEMEPVEVENTDSAHHRLRW